MERTLDYRTAHLDDTTLLQRVHALLARDHRTSALLLAHLGEVDARGLHRDAGYSSLHGYCVEALHMSEGEAALRIRAARLARQYPDVLNHVERGELHLSALRVLAPVLNDDNHEQLLRSAVHKTKAEVEVLVADLAPKADARQLVRKLPALPAEAVPLAQTDLLTPPPAPTVTTTLRPAARPAPVPRPVTPLGQERYRIQLTASQALHDKLKQAQELLRHRVPNGDVATVLELALERLVSDLKKERFAQTDRPRKSRGAPNPKSRHIPHQVRREVVERDHERCTFVSADGHRCTATGMLEFDHVDAFARGGLPVTDKVRLLCRAHNQLQAERAFGRAFMKQARTRRDSAQQALWPVPPVRSGASESSDLVARNLLAHAASASWKTWRGAGKAEHSETTAHLWCHDDWSAAQLGVDVDRKATLGFGENACSVGKGLCAALCEVNPELVVAALEALDIVSHDERLVRHENRPILVPIRR